MAILPRSTPTAEGVDPRRVANFFKRAGERPGQQLHGVRILRHGKVIAEADYAPYQKGEATMLFSLSKSFTSTAVGFAVSENLLKTSDLVLSFFPEYKDLPGLWQKLTVRHLLSMNTGHIQDTTGYMTSRADGDWVRGFFSCPIEREPGTHFLYNTGATYMLSAIVQKLSGQTVREYLMPRLFAPLEIPEPKWDQCPKGVNTGGFGLWLDVESIARFGQFLLQKGLWEGKRLLPEAWFDEATFPHSDNSNGDGSADWASGYGYQFWRCVSGGYRGDGAFGQYCVVLPQKELVVAITSGVQDMQMVLTDIWTQLLPGVDAVAAGAPTAQDEQLASLLKGLSHAAAAYGESDLPKAISGKKYVFSKNPALAWIRFTFGAESCVAEFELEGRAMRLEAGYGAWHVGRAAMPIQLSITDMEIEAVACACAWTKPDTLEITLRDLKSPFVLTFTYAFYGENVVFSQSANVGFERMPQIHLCGAWEA